MRERTADTTTRLDTHSMKENEPRTLYAVLGVDIKASQDAIRRQYLRLARAAKRKFQEVVAAFEVLSDPVSRSNYDVGLLDQLDVEDYLQRFQGLILTVCGLGMTSAPQQEDARASPQAGMRRVRSKGWLLTI